MNIYLAGGAVRDLLLGNSITDRDYLVTEITQEEFKRRFPLAKRVGKSFPVFLINGCEFSFLRAPTLDKDLKNRDLTVNALTLDENGTLLCHPKALEDLHTLTLRPASSHAFQEDPLRIFRAARFWAKFPDFSPHQELLDSMHSVARKGLLNTLAPDRIGQETLKALSSARPGNYLRLLALGGCLSPWFTEFDGGLSIPAGPSKYHNSNVIEHTAEVMDRMAGESKQVWMGFCHDLGKTSTPKELLPSHYGHDKRGIKRAVDIASRIRLSNSFSQAGSQAARWHMLVARYDELRPTTKVDLLVDLHISKCLQGVLTLVVADQSLNFTERALRDLELILSVSLPPNMHNKGPASGKLLRELRASELRRYS